MGNLFIILLVIAGIVFIGTLLSGGDTDDAAGNAMATGMMGLGCLWELFWMGISVLFALWVLSMVCG